MYVFAGAVMLNTLCSCSKNKDKISSSLVENSTSIKFEKDLIDFGTLQAGEIATCSFKFTNTGKNDLIISSVTANCGCTVVDFPKDAIKPGDQGQITATYNSEGSAGLRIQKEITVVSNTQPSATRLHIMAEVK
jgi:Protein of unknown function (DUF1573).